MDLEQARKIIAKSEEEGKYISFRSYSVCLDGHFNSEDLQALIMIMKNIVTEVKKDE